MYQPTRLFLECSASVPPLIIVCELKRFYIWNNFRPRSSEMAAEHSRWGGRGPGQVSGGLPDLAPPRALPHPPVQEPQQASDPQRGRCEARGALEDFRAAPAHQAGQTQGLLQPWRHHGTLWWLFSDRERILFRPTSPVLQLNSKFLQNGKASSSWRNVRSCFQWWSRILGNRRIILGVMLPTQVSPAQRTRPRGDAEGGRVPQDPGGGGGLGRREVCKISKVSLGPPGETHDLSGCKGE